MRGVLSGPLTPVRLRSVVAALEAAIGDARTLQQLTAKALGPMVAEDCPEGFTKDPDTGECIEESRGTRPMTGAESFAKSKLSRDLQRLHRSPFHFRGW